MPSSFRNHCQHRWAAVARSSAADRSFWRASAIIRRELGSSAYYVVGIAEKAIGKAAPRFVLAVMLFSYAVRAVYIESCNMSIRDGVSRVVRHALSGTAAKFCVSALILDYVLTGPFSGVSVALYWPRPKRVRTALPHCIDAFPCTSFAAGFAILVMLYFWYTNRLGILFSSISALRIMQATTVMVVVLIRWSLYTGFTKGFQPVPSPLPSHPHFGDTALGWL